MTNKTAILWFRKDLRLRDNSALNYILEHYENIVPIYIFDKRVNIGKVSSWWLLHSLNKLNIELKNTGSKLYFFTGNSTFVIKELIDKNKIEGFYWNRLYDNFSIKNDSIIKKILEKKNIRNKSFKDNILFEPWEIKNQNGNFFKVFTPYWKTCLENINLEKIYNEPKKIYTKKIISNSIVSLDKYSFDKIKLLNNKKLHENWKPGEREAQKKFENFINYSSDKYSINRDRPDLENTSKLSPHIHFGEISVKEIYIKTIKAKNIDFVDKKKFLSEIGWREFSYNLLYNYPNIQKIPIQSKFLKFPWENNNNLQNWKLGKTGIPIVDAGMRQLYETGWMHNRVRMIVGSFLTKNLLIHWHEGEKWFFNNLVDADIASNSAGWQWISGCGADAAPYFRIFNPTLQGEKFDPEGNYVKKYIANLTNLPNKLIHKPWSMSNDEQKKYKCTIGKDYPYPIVDLSITRERALKAFKKL